MLPIEPGRPVEGNMEVVALLEHWLARAKLGRMDYVAIAASEGEESCFDDYAGAFNRQFVVNWAIDSLKERMRTESRYLHAPAINYDVPGNLYMYNIATAPCCFDFAAWIVIAEMARRREKITEPLKIGFRFGIDAGDRAKALRSRRREEMFEHVMRPLVKMIGGIEDNDAIHNGRKLEVYTFHPIVRAHKAGEQVPRFKPSAEAMEAVANDLVKGRPPVTITLRESDYEEHRNSNFGEWLRFAEYLKANGERVVFIRDTAKASEPIRKFEVCPGAACDLDIRLALYESAKCNLSVANGPWCLCLFGSAPWMSFVELNAMDPYTPNTPHWYKTYHGIALGEQYPWSTPDQRMVWKRDTFENLCEAWEAWQATPVAEAAE